MLKLMLNRIKTFSLRTVLWIRLMILYYMIGGQPQRVQYILAKEFKVDPVKSSIGNIWLLLFDPPIPPILAFLAIFTTFWQTYLVIEIGVIFIIAQYIFQTAWRLTYIAIKNKPIGNWEKELIYNALIWLNQAERIERWIAKTLYYTRKFYNKTLETGSKLNKVMKKTNSIKKQE